MVWCNFSAGWDYTKYYYSGDQVLSKVYGHPTNWRIKPIYISKTVTIPVGKSMQTHKYLSTPQMNWKSVLLRFQVDTYTSPQILQSENSPTQGEKTWKNVSTFDILGADNQIKVTQRFQSSSGWQLSSVHGYVSKLGGFMDLSDLGKKHVQNGQITTYQSVWPPPKQQIHNGIMEVGGEFQRNQLPTFAPNFTGGVSIRLILLEVF